VKGPSKITIQIKQNTEGVSLLTQSQFREHLITGGDRDLPLDDHQINMHIQDFEDDLKKESLEHKRTNSDYSNGSQGMLSPSNNKNLGKIQKKMIELLENGLAYLNKEQVEEALREFKVCEALY
jgi:hypothetical protein